MTLTSLARSLFGIGLLCIALGPTAAAKVGVTSGSDGDPVGKPPSENERILRVGIDIQADEMVTTHENDRVHLVFLDGTALTVSANAQVKIDRFVYDPASNSGELGITAVKGVFRLVGGKISKSNAITVQTPSATLGLRGGIGMFTVGADGTTARFLFGKSLQVTAGGHTETAWRPGTEIRVSTGGLPSPPSLVARGALAQQLRALENARASTNKGPDDQAKRSGFSDRNSGQQRIGFGDSSVIAATQAANNALSQIRPLTDTPVVTTTVATVPVVTPPPPPPPPPPPLCPPPEYWHHHHHDFDFPFTRR